MEEKKQAVKTEIKKVSKKTIVKDIFEKKEFQYAILGIIIFIASFLIQYFINKPDFGIF